MTTLNDLNETGASAMSEVNNTKAYPSDIPIECAKTRKCGWQGMESDMKRIPHPTIKIASQLVCPKCGEKGYYRRERS